MLIKNRDQPTKPVRPPAGGLKKAEISLFSRPGATMKYRNDPEGGRLPIKLDPTYMTYEQRSRREFLSLLKMTGVT